jgi:hypothetical protein
VPIPTLSESDLTVEAQNPVRALLALLFLEALFRSQSIAAFVALYVVVEFWVAR